VQLAAAPGDDADRDVPPPGCSRYAISLKKPLGLVLEQNKATLAITVVR
jgi:hypothetical protein